MTASQRVSERELGDPPLPASRSRYSRALWWARVVEVRFRFVLLVLIVLVLVTQWKRVRQAWDDGWHAWLHSSTPSTVSGSTEYFCPMDPGVVSVWPAVCPICSMDLVQRRKHDAQLLPEGVIARMQISPYRVQLAGIRTAVVEPRELTYDIPVAGVLVDVSETPADPTGAVAANATGESSELVEGRFEFAFTAAVSRDDRPLLTQPRSASVWTVADRAVRYDAEAVIVTTHPAVRGSLTPHSNGTAGLLNLEPLPIAGDLRPAGSAGSGDPRQARSPHVLVRVSEVAGVLAAGMFVQGVIRVPASDLPGGDKSHRGTEPATKSMPLLAVPESAVVDHGDRQLVFVESMPGTFDAVVVTLGRRCGDSYPVLSGLQPQQRVAVSGAFLIDAETRLNPSLSVGYFGANQTSSADRAPNVRVAAPAKTGPPAKLSPDELRLSKQQKTCPVTGLPLDSMGGPVKTMVGDRKVFLCCQGCESKLQAEPAKYLAKLPPP